MTYSLENVSQQQQRVRSVKLYIFILTFAAFSIVTYIFMYMQQGLEPRFAAPQEPVPLVRPLQKSTYKSDKTTTVSSSNRDNNVSPVYTKSTDSPTQPQKQQTKKPRPLQQQAWEPFNTTNPHVHSWCPHAHCLNSPLCTPCSQRFFFLISTARSGSTTLLRMFNALPHIRLSGENHNHLYYLYQLTSNLVNHKPYILKHPVDKPTGPFQHNAIPQGSMGCVAQTAVKSLNPPPLDVQRNVAAVASSTSSPTLLLEEYDRGRILGFKTVRVHHGNWTAKEVAEYLKTHFPCSKVLINYQTNVTHEYLSFKRTFHHNNDGGGKDKEYKGPSIEYFKQINKFQEDLSHSLGDEMSRLIDMDQWVHDVEILNSVIQWMGYEKCRFNKIVHENDKGYSTDKDTILSVGEECSYPYFL
jgi:hypothetical protein